MKIFKNVKSYSVTWLANTYDKDTSQGTIANYYLPETMEELTELCRELYRKNEKFHVVGSSSNVYIRPNTSFKHLISIKLLNRFYLDNDFMVCECGASVKRIVGRMVTDGIDGYACMIDLPGTIGGGVYGNAGVSKHSIVRQLKDVTVLLDNGSIRTFSPDDLGFTFRFSALKRGELQGIILSCRLKRTPGNKKEIEDEAMMVHEWRKENQPGAARNLGTTSLLSIAKPTMKGNLLRAITKCFAYVLKPNDEAGFKTRFIMKALGKPELSKYLFGLNRYMWMDAKAHENFEAYVEAINQLYVKPKLEIEVW